MTYVKKVKITVEIEDGTKITTVETDPSPTGSNPAYLTMEFRSALAAKVPEIEGILAAKYGKQWAEVDR